jgi:hypothetical protein
MLRMKIAPCGRWSLTVINSEWYSQCVGLGSPDNSQTGGEGQVVTRTLSTVFSVGGAMPTVVTTYITFITPVVTQAQPTFVQPTYTGVPDQPITAFVGP